MFEVVASDWMRNYLKDRRKFTDWEKAALIWNSSMHTWKERLDSLKELADTTEDVILKNQIHERICYEETAYQLFVDNRSKHYVYVVVDDDRDPCGYFTDFEMARLYGIKCCEDYGCHHYAIEKQLLYGEVTKNEVVNPKSLHDSMVEEGVLSDTEYEGRENAYASYNSKGELRLFYSLEMPEENNETEGEMSRHRFENLFFEIPFGMEKGTIVKMLNEGSYAVVAQGEKEWNRCMARARKVSYHYDYADIQVVVFTINSAGYWSHHHVNPLYLEPEFPAVEAGNKKEETYRDALIALRSYFQNNTKEDNEKAIKASKKYAEACAGFINWPRLVYEADDMEQLLW